MLGFKTAAEVGQKKCQTLNEKRMVYAIRKTIYWAQVRSIMPQRMRINQ